IRVRTEWTGQRVKVEVEDSGIGIDPDEADRLFTLFHTTKANGMGMGLSICRSIVNNHGGMLAFRRNSGPGVTFYFTLPIEDEDG
ncbi:MAG: ATP-binding protein, partial [Gammaproteobacteria bacterium]|nr:ATP-binding protein [Gammaproteobacteria bacterium]